MALGKVSARSLGVLRDKGLDFHLCGGDPLLFRLYITRKEGFSISGEGVGKVVILLSWISIASILCEDYCCMYASQSLLTERRAERLESV